MLMEYKNNDIYQPITADMLSMIPASMKSVPRWIVWGGRKIPVNGHIKGEHGYIGADVTKETSWMSYDDAVRLVGAKCCVNSESFHACGIGFVVGDGWFCLDMDGGEKHGKEPVPESAVQNAMKLLETYTEKSLSGCGYHLFGISKELKILAGEPEHYQPNQRRNSYEIEVFARRKFIALTGNRIPGSNDDAIDCGAAAQAYYHSHILTPWKVQEEQRIASLPKLHPPVNADEATQMFLNCYREILNASDSSNYKRHQWIGLVKAMREIGIPYADVLDWCRRGSNFKDERDVEKVWNEQKGAKDKPASVAALINEAKLCGWKPDPNQLTGEYRATYEAAQQARKERSAMIHGITILPANPEAAKPTSQENPQPVIGGYDDVETKPTDFLFFPWFPRGKLVAVQGDSGSSKSTFMYAVGALVSTGSDLLGTPCEDPGNVMFITIEDDPGDIKTAFTDAGGDLTKLKRIVDREDIAKLNLSPSGAQDIDRIIKEHGIKLLVLDPIQQFLAGDMNKANETRPQLSRLMNIAAENNICIVFIEHMGKDTSKAALHRGVGSVDIGASTRSMIQVITDPEDDYCKIAFTVKNNTADSHDTQRAIRYQVMDHPNSYNPETKKRERFHGHAVFREIMPEYNERQYRKAMRKAEEAEQAEETLAFEYNDDPLVITARQLIAENPHGLFVGTDDLIQKITLVCGRCPYDQTKSKITGIYSRVSRMRSLMIDSDGIQIDIQSNSIWPKSYNWHGTHTEPSHTRTKGFTLTPVRASKEGYQQTKV